MLAIKNPLPTVDIIIRYKGGISDILNDYFSGRC